MKSSRTFAGVCLVAVLGCGPEEDTAGPAMNAAAGSKGTGVTVSAADPSYGHQGELHKQVRIIGSGFEPGDQAAWQRNGVTDPKIQVLSTEFVSSSEVVATVTIAPDATLSFYDIAIVRPGRKGGIGTMLFEVTQAIPVPGTSIIRGVNDAGLLGGADYGNGNSSGSGARLLVPGSGLISLPEIVADRGGVTAIDEAGRTMTGFDGNQAGVTPVWTGSGTSWTVSALPDDPLAVGGHGWAIASHQTTGEAVYIGGHENFLVKHNSTINRPRLWQRSLSGWTRIILPSLASDGSGVVKDVTPTGVAVGWSNGRAVIWEPTGSGGYTITLLPGTESIARGITSDGALIVGGTRAYWLRTGSGTWNLQLLPVNCGAVMAVDDLGRIAADNCERSGRTVQPAVFVPPYSAAPIWLGFLGAKSSAANVEHMSLHGGYIAGQINTQGVYWKVF